MRVPTRLVVAAAVAALAALVSRPLAARAPSPPSALDAAFAAFWAADTPAAAEQAAARVRALAPPFDDTYARLRAGRPYAAAPTGTRSFRAPGPGGQPLDNTVEVPPDYDPAKQWPLRVQLHGGISRPEPGDQRRRGNRIPGEPQIYAMPVGYAEAAWWDQVQVDNILGLVDRIKRAYNVDESRIYLTGISDGGTGTYYLAMKAATVWSSFLPLNGHLAVLANPSVGADGQLYPSNLMNRALYVVNGGRDPLYPAGAVAPYVEMLKRAGVDVTFRPQPGAGHDTSWWPVERAPYEAFVTAHPRQPHPSLLSWETERTDRGNRVHWLVIDRLGPTPSDAPLADVNEIQEVYEPDFGLRPDLRKDDGRVVDQVLAGSDAEKMGLKPGDRIVRVDGRGVASMTQILEAFNAHAQGPITIEVERAGQVVSTSGPFPPQPTPGPVKAVFRRDQPSGRVDVVRTGNRFEARSRGVTRFTLLLSPDAVDFGAPVRVTVNGRTAFEGPVAPSLEVLLKWAARDNDRTMLYGAELPITVQ
jgi:predicted esterase